MYIDVRDRFPDLPSGERTLFAGLEAASRPVEDLTISEWADRVADQLSAGRDAYVFCHSPDNYLAPFIAKEFHQQISSRIKIAPLPWDDIDLPSEPFQPMLF